MSRTAALSTAVLLATLTATPAAGDGGGAAGGGHIQGYADHQPGGHPTGGNPGGGDPGGGVDDTGSNPFECEATNCVLPPGSPAPAGPGPVDAAALALSASDEVPLVQADIQMAPQPPLKTYVNLETWLWLPREQWRNVSVTVTAGPTSVTVVAEPVEVVWDLGEGTKTCSSAGRPWVHGMGDFEKTDCDYVYQSTSDGQSGDRYPVTANIVYRASWTCSGQCTSPGGSLGEVAGPTGETAIEVSERQSVIIGGS